MKLISKISLGISAISLLTLVLSRIFLGGWISVLWGPFIFFVGGILVSFIFDIRQYWYFINMKTTKNGMNFGLSVLMMLAVLSSVAYLSVLWNQNFDLTEEKLNSLSPQTTQVLDSMKKNGLNIQVFYKGQNAQREKEIVRANLQLFTQYMSNLKVKYYNAELENVLAQQYLKDLTDKRSHNIFIFIEYLDKRIRVDFPFDEEVILSALIKAKKRVRSNIYVTAGHGERDLFSQEAQGLSAFRQALEKTSLNVLEWNFIEKQKPLPKDAQALLILGPTRPFFEQEIQWIKEYIQTQNGKVMIALDPGSSHNLTNFVAETLGIRFKNNFISSSISQIFRKPTTSVLGMTYSNESSITQKINQQYKGQLGSSIFDEVSELDKDPSIHPDWKVFELVKTDPSCFALSSLGENSSNKERKSRVVAMAVEEAPPQDSSKKTDKNKESKAGNKEKETARDKKKDGFVATVFGDSDFLTNQSWLIGAHKDLALNTVSYLADQGDLVSIRPKTPKGTKITLTRSSQYFFAIFAIVLPLLLFILAIISFLYRKKA